MSQQACPEREPQLEALLFSEISDADRHALERHLALCPGCREALHDARRAWHALSKIEAPSPFEDSERDPWSEFRARLESHRHRAPRPSSSARTWVAMAAVLLVGVGLGRILSPTGGSPALPAAPTAVDTARVEAESLAALERAELLADTGVRYVDGLRELLSEVAEVTIAVDSSTGVLSTREHARSLLRDGRLLQRRLDPERDRLFLQSIRRAEVFLEELAALEPRTEEGDVRLLKASLSETSLRSDLDRLDLDREVTRALEASGGLATEIDLSRKEF